MQLALTQREDAGTATPVRGLVAVLWRRRLLAALAVVLVAVTVAAVLILSPHQYTAATRVAATPVASADSPADYQDLLGTIADVAQSRPVLEQVQKAVPSRSLEQLQHEVSGSVVFGTVLIQISVTDTDASLAAQIANAVAAALPQHNPSADVVTLAATQPAAVPTGFSSPDVRVVALAGVLLAIALAVAAALVYDRMARTVDTPEELTEITGARVLGVVPRPDDPRSAVTPETGPQPPGLRALRVALEFACMDRPTRLLVVASAAADPWPGWLEVNLAVALAEVGHRVLLVDADRSTAGRHPVFDVPSRPGLYDVLAGTASLDEASVAGPMEGIAVVPLGNVEMVAPSLLELRFGELLEEVDARYDVVLVHAAPVGHSDDARILSIGGGLLLVAPVGRVRPRALRAAVASLAQVRTRVLGTVVLGTRRR